MFVPGLEVSRALYDESVGPTLRRRFPGVRHAAGLDDGGSEVLGFDTARSMDHDWGARLQVFLADADRTASYSMYCGSSFGTARSTSASAPAPCHGTAHSDANEADRAVHRR